MRLHVSLTALSAALLLLAASMQPASALTKVQANGLCAMFKIQQCPKQSQPYHYQYCSQHGWGTIAYDGGAIPCCRHWVCGFIH